MRTWRSSRPSWTSFLPRADTEAMRKRVGIALALLTVTAHEAADMPSGQPANQFITLGTHGGPVSDRNRSQPANALVVGEAVYLVDAGDGAVQQLARAGAVAGGTARGVHQPHPH